MVGLLQIVRGRAELPHGTGKKMVVAVFARDDKVSFTFVIRL